jgi:hypothetical protein
MARALECPACGARHPVDGREPASEFRCERCGQKLLVPAAAAAAAVGAAAASPAPPPRRRGGGAGTAAMPAGTVTVTLPASGSTPPKTPVKPVQPAAEPPAREKRKVAWYWRVLAWIVAVPLGFVIAVWPSYEFGLISKDDVLNIFVGSGISRYVRLGAVTAIWAIVTALLVQLFVEGGKWWASRRRRRKAAPRTGPTPVPSPGRP